MRFKIGNQSVFPHNIQITPFLQKAVAVRVLTAIFSYIESLKNQCDSA